LYVLSFLPCIVFYQRISYFLISSPKYGTRKKRSSLKKIPPRLHSQSLHLAEVSTHKMKTRLTVILARTGKRYCNSTSINTWWPPTRDFLQRRPKYKRGTVNQTKDCDRLLFNLLKPTGHVMHQNVLH